MSIRVAIRHRTTYRYDRSVSLTPHIVRLMPAVHCRTPIEAYSLRIEPGNHFINCQQDPFGNRLARVVFPGPCRELSVHIEVQAKLTIINPFDFFIEPYAESYPFVYDEQLQKELVPYLEITEQGPLLTEWLASLDRHSDSTVNFMVSLNHRLWQGIRYTLRMEPGIQTCEQTLKLASGSCRDSAWLLVQIFRHLGLAARFVSGYLVQLKADMESLDGPSGPVEDFTDLHAWAEVYIPGAGWLGLDPTSGLFAGEGHIPLACTPDPVSAAPVAGGFLDEAECEFDFSNSVVRVHENPRVTQPYSDAEWLTIESLGEQVDQTLSRLDVRLTMGGEPTFVSIDTYDTPEWTTAADGPHKRERAHDLTRRLRSAFAPEGVLHSGLGKWYPGEPLPRWQMGCYWRRDGAPVWHDPSLLADESRDYGMGLAQAQALTKELTLRLGIQPDYILPGFEDVLYYLWKEGTLPNNIDPLKGDLDDPLERQRLTRLLDRGLNTATGDGNHLTLGGLSPTDSPLLRRPDLLRSLLTYWQHHPGLSYLFSGLFVGPTSQAPRIDEARHESLYELEITLRQMPAGETPARWLVDRLLRHLLTGITGNTHRAEFCIDKLYSPDSSRGRGCWSYAPSKCRPMSVWRCCRTCWCGLCWRDSGNSRIFILRCAGVPSCTTGSCCRIMSCGTWARSSTTCAKPATRSRKAGWTRTTNSASLTTAPCTIRTSRWNCAAPSSRGMCSGKRPFPAAPPVWWIAHWSGYRSRRAA